MATLYGIKACDTCRKAIKELEASGKSFEFRDIRADPLAPEEIREFVEAFGDALINRRSTTWRGLSEDERKGDVVALITAFPTLMKRPVITDGATRTLGWDAASKAKHLG